MPNLPNTSVELHLTEVIAWLRKAGENGEGA